MVPTSPWFMIISTKDEVPSEYAYMRNYRSQKQAKQAAYPYFDKGYSLLAYLRQLRNGTWELYMKKGK